MHRDRIKLWEEFNTAWLSALQRQKELTIEMLDTGQRPHHPQSLLESDQMDGMGKELVRLCDIMEKHGLVDYQMGVWEEEIIGRKCHFALFVTVTVPDLFAVLNTCLDLLEEQSENSRAAAPPSSSAQQRRR